MKELGKIWREREAGLSIGGVGGANSAEVGDLAGELMTMGL